MSVDGDDGHAPLIDVSVRHAIVPAMNNEPKPTRAYVVRVSHADTTVPGGNMLMRYAALTTTEAEALECVRAVRPSIDELTLLPERLSAETTKMLGLAVGQAWCL